MSLLGEARDLALDHGLWWPDGDPGRLRHLAHAWEAAATACDFAADDVVHAVRRVRLDNEGRAIDAFTDHSDLVVLELGDEADRCRQVAGTLHGRADDIEQARRRIEALAVEVATALVAGALLTLFTGGVSDLMAAELTATAVADAAAIGLTMSETAIALTARIAAYATLGAWEAGVIDVATQTAGNVVQNHDPFEGFSEQRFMIDVGAGGVLGGLVGGLTFVAPPPPTLPVVGMAREEAEVVAGRIARGHAWEKHVVKRGEFLTIHTQQEFADEIQRILEHPSRIRRMPVDRWAYWDDGSGTVVIVNPADGDFGSAYVPDKGLSYFNEELRR